MPTTDPRERQYRDDKDADGEEFSDGDIFWAFSLFLVQFALYFRCILRRELREYRIRHRRRLAMYQNGDIHPNPDEGTTNANGIHPGDTHGTNHPQRTP